MPKISQLDMHPYSDVVKAVQNLNAKHHSRKASPAKLPPMVIGVIGDRGSGKTLHVAAMCSALFRMGIPVYASKAAGFRFGEGLGFDFSDPDNEEMLTEIYTFSTSKSKSVCFVDEVATHVHANAAMSSRNQIFEECIANLRKAECMLIYTAQSQERVPASLRRDTNVAQWALDNSYEKVKLPQPEYDFETGKWIREETVRNVKMKPKKGEPSIPPWMYLKWCHVKIAQMSGRRPFEYPAMPQAYQRARNEQGTNPVRFDFTLDPKTLFEASKLYSSWEHIPIGERYKTTGEHMKEAIIGGAEESA